MTEGIYKIKWGSQGIEEFRRVEDLDADIPPSGQVGNPVSVAILGSFGQGKSYLSSKVGVSFDSSARVYHGMNEETERDYRDAGVEIVEDLNDAEGNLLILDDADGNEESNLVLSNKRHLGKNILYIAHNPGQIEPNRFDYIALFDPQDFGTQDHRFREEFFDKLESLATEREREYILGKYDGRNSKFKFDIRNDGRILTKLLSNKEILWDEFREENHDGLSELHKHRISESLKGRPKNDESKKEAIRLLKVGKFSQKEIGQRVGLTEGRISQISKEVN